MGSAYASQAAHIWQSPKRLFPCDMFRQAHHGEPFQGLLVVHLKAAGTIVQTLRSSFNTTPIFIDFLVRPKRCHVLP